MLSCLVNSRFQFTLTIPCEEHRKNSCRPSPLPTDHCPLSSFFSYSYELFCTSQIHISFVFMQFRTLSPKQRGVGTYPILIASQPPSTGSPIRRKLGPLRCPFSSLTDHGSRNTFMSQCLCDLPALAELALGPCASVAIHRTKLLRPRNIK